jgi:hypothetical protein
LIIVHDGNAVSITDGTGRHMSYKADGKKQQPCGTRGTRRTCYFTIGLSFFN